MCCYLWVVVGNFLNEISAFEHGTSNETSAIQVTVYYYYVCVYVLLSVG